MIKKILKFIIPVLIVVFGFFVTGWMLSTPQRAERQEIPEKITPVEVLQAESSNQMVYLDVQGTVTPAESIVLSPQVSGRVIDLHPDLLPGGLLRKDQVILRIDPRDYEFAVEAARERVAGAEFQLKLEKGQQTVAKQEWELLEDSVPTTEAGRELALRKPHIESAEASLKAARSALEKTKLDLSRTTLEAPFNAIIIQENVDLGQLVSPQTNVASLAGTDKFWVRVSIPIDELSWIEIPSTPRGRGSEAMIIQDTGKAGIAHTGYVVRLLGDLDKGRLARLLVAVEDPLMIKSGQIEGKLPLLIGSYVNVRIEGGTVENVFVIPRKALRDVEAVVEGEGVTHNWVYIMDSEDRLTQRQVSIVWRDKENVFVDGGLEEGERVILSTISTPIVGMKLSLANGYAATE
jgi:RND family efflux transporter MFP subunit